MKHKAFANLLASSFVNGRGELCHNLDSSRSKVAAAKRAEREARKAREARVVLECRLQDALARFRREGSKPEIMATIRKLQAALGN